MRSKQNLYLKKKIDTFDHLFKYVCNKLVGLHENYFLLSKQKLTLKNKNLILLIIFSNTYATNWEVSMTITFCLFALKLNYKQILFQPY